MAGQHWNRDSPLLLVVPGQKSVVPGPRLSFGTRWGCLGVEGNASQKTPAQIVHPQDTSLPHGQELVGLQTSTADF